MGPELKLQSGPQGFYKPVEIGVNNYDPSTFLKQRFRLYFFKKDDCDEVVDPSAEVISGPQSSMLPSEYELMSKRLK